MFLHSLVTFPNIPRLRYMRPFFFFSFFSVVTLVTADHTELIDNQDKRITYTDGWKTVNSAGGGTLAFNDNDSGTASLRVYNASRIAVRVFVEGIGQVVRISLDNNHYDIKPLLYLQPAWTSDILNPSAPHDLVVIKRNPKGQYIELDNILVTYYDPPVTTRDQLTATAAPASNAPNQLMPSPATAIVAPPSTQIKSMGGTLSSDRLLSDSSPEINTSGASGETNAGTNSGGFDVTSSTTQSTVQSDPSIPPLFTSPLIPQASPTTSAQQPNTESVLSGGKLAAVILACIAAPILIVAGIILYRRRMIVKRKAASTAYREWIATHGDVPPGPVFSPPPPHEKVGGTEDLVRPGSPTSVSGDSDTVAVTL